MDGKSTFVLHVTSLGPIEGKEVPVDNDLLSRNFKIGTAIACAAITFLPLVFIAFAGVNVPFADEWWYSGLVNTAKSGEATFETFWSPNNEHRMLLPRLEFASLAILTHWNSKIIMLVAWFVMAIAASFLFLQFNRIYSKSHPIFWAASSCISVAVLLCLVQHENWLWAFQFAFFFIQLSALVSVFTICRSDLALPLRLIVAVGFAVAASYSSAQGLLVWPALVLSLCLTNDSRRTKAIGMVFLMVAALGTVWFYFLGLTRDGSLQLRTEQFAGKPQLPFVGFLGLAGNSLAGWISYEHRPHRAWLVGLAATALLVGFVVLLIRRRQISRAAPWLGLAVFSYLFCFVTTFGRLGLGYTGGFLASRYVSHVTFIVIALLALLVLAIDSTSSEPEALKLTGRRLDVVLAFCLIFAIGALVVVGDARAFLMGMKEREDRLLGRELIPFYTYFDPRVDGVMSGPFFSLCPLRLKIFDVGLKPLLDEGYFRRLPPVAFVEAQSDASGKYSVSPKLEEHRYLGIVRLGWQLTGSVMAGASRDADLVFLKPNGAAGFIGAAKLTPASADKGKLRSWSLFLSPLLYSDRSISLEMWIFDRQANQFVKLKDTSANHT
jgi:hypothetical protein